MYKGCWRVLHKYIIINTWPPFLIICSYHNNISFFELCFPWVCKILCHNVYMLGTKHKIKVDILFIAFFGIDHKIITNLQTNGHIFTTFIQLIPFIFICTKLNGRTNITWIIRIQQFHILRFSLGQIHTCCEITIQIVAITTTTNGYFAIHISSQTTKKELPESPHLRTIIPCKLLTFCDTITFAPVQSQVLHNSRTWYHRKTFPILLLYTICD